MTWNIQWDVTSNFTKQWVIQNDLWAWLDYNDDIMTDENDDIIIFHTWLFWDWENYYDTQSDKTNNWIIN